LAAPVDFLVADIGNRFLKVGQVHEGRILAHHRIPISDRVQDADLSLEIPPAAVVFASVNPAVDPVFEAWAAERFGLKAEKLERDRPIPIRNRCQGVGADRLLNALAGIRRHPEGVVAVDVGTAVTVDAAGPGPEFLGGAILPGPHLGAWALAEKAAQLFEVEPAAPRTPLATETREALRSGLYHGTIGAVERLVRAYGSILDFEPTLVVTGGEALMVLDAFPGAVHCPLLTLEGMVVAALQAA